MLIQEMLQTENAFNLQLIVEGQDTQLSLNWRTLDEKRKATDICRGCDTFELNNRIELLVEKIINDPSEEKVQFNERIAANIFGYFRNPKKGELENLFDTILGKLVEEFNKNSIFKKTIEKAIKSCLLYTSDAADE